MKICRNPRVDRSVRHPPPPTDRETEQQHAFGRQYALLLPCRERVQILAFDQMSGQRFDPGRIDTGNPTQIPFGGLDQFRGDDPFRASLERAGTGPQIELLLVAAQVFILAVLDRHGRQQARQQRAVDGRMSRAAIPSRTGGARPDRATGDARPATPASGDTRGSFADTSCGADCGKARPSRRDIRPTVLANRRSLSVRRTVAMRLVGRRLFVDRALARILDLKRQAAMIESRSGSFRRGPPGSCVRFAGRPEAG